MTVLHRKWQNIGWGGGGVQQYKHNYILALNLSFNLNVIILFYQYDKVDL